MAVEAQLCPPGTNTQTKALAPLAESEASTMVPSSKTAPEPLPPPVDPMPKAASSGWGLPIVTLPVGEARAWLAVRAVPVMRTAARATALLTTVNDPGQPGT